MTVLTRALNHLWLLLGAPLSISSAWPLPLPARVVSTVAGPHSFLLSRGQQWFPGKWRGPMEGEGKVLRMFFSLSM